MRKPRCLKSDKSRYLFIICHTVGFVVLAAGASLPCLVSCFVKGWGSGLIRDPATQQLSKSPPRIRKLPLQPKALMRYWFKGARVLKKTGLPAMAKPLAMGRFLKKYFPIMVKAGWRLKARPRPERE